VRQVNKFFIVFSHTYLVKLKSKPFIISSIVSVAFILLLSNLDTIIERFQEEEAKKVLVIDETNKYLPLLEKQLESIKANIELQSYSGTEKRALKKVENDEVAGFLILSTSKEGLPSAVFKANIVTNENWISDIEQALQRIKVLIATNQLGLNPIDIAKIYEPVSFEKISLKKQAKTEEELNESRGVVYLFLFLIYFAVIFYGTMISTEVATEKSSRVMEILISSVSPVTQMFGKILGVAALGLTQFSLILTAGYVGTMIKSKEGEGQTTNFVDFISFNELPALTVMYALLYFVLGFLLYATVLAMLGSLVSRVEEVNQIVSPVIILMVVGFFIAMTGLENPDTNFIQMISYVPFFTPMIMFLRVGLLEVPIWEVAISILIMIATTACFAVIGGKVYRGGVLMYGTSVSFKSIKKAFRLSKKQ
jgi:ABC-2 type transport system permease protein